MRTEEPTVWPFPSVKRRTLLRALLYGAASGAALGTLGLSPRAGELASEEIVLTMLGILQPASAEEVFCILELLHDAAAAEGMALDLERPRAGEISEAVEALQRQGAILPVQANPVRRYSMTAAGNRRLSPRLRATRDTTRLFLLHGPRARIMEMSREGREGESGGASPPSNLRSLIDSLGRPLGSTEDDGNQPPTRAWPVARHRLWSRHCRTSPLALSRDTSLRFLSFDSLEQLRLAGGTSGMVSRLRLSPQGIALSLGVSLQFLRWLRDTRYDRHYRSFAIPKRGGGKRWIESPRIFLKVTQRFVLHHILSGQPVHDTVHSFVPAVQAGELRNSITNARRHLAKPYVAKIDIKDFFGSLRGYLVDQAFQDTALLNADARRLLSSLCTRRNALPQGAPTSPMISNLILRRFDENMARLCSELDLVYTRYADDITISGAVREDVELAAWFARKGLTGEPLTLPVNEDKSRILSAGQQQRVTGVIVNERGLPPRRMRRRVRAMFHQAALDPARLREERARLGGYLAYFRAFPDYPSGELARYARVLAQK
ncbi:reverse transcriptase domain-containing protein [Pelagibius marinus]|uniref:reverse transcriptase domain-containing protein n=1 Tax=Pelagibius marinus TaxID=2762760 RepID=UPI001872E051|nr:reverse transcriptase domain-containing protein [Pelagibius marinus]